MVIFGVIIAIVLTVAIIVGVYTTFLPNRGSFDGSTNSIKTDDSVSSSVPTPTPEQVPTRSTPESTIESTPSVTEFTIESTPSVTPQEKIRNDVASLINNYRSTQGLPELSTDSYLSSRLTEMANVHSRRMMTKQTVLHNIQGNTTKDRYDAYELSDRCSFPSNNGYSTIDEARGSIELVSKPISPALYENKEGGYNGNSTKVAHKTLADWKSDNLQKKKLEFSNADQAGIGVSISEGGGVYITVALCG